MPYSIAIAGCGVAGLTAALLLAGQGHSVTLFEQSAQVGPAGAGVLLQPSGQLVLDRIGLLSRVVARAERIDRLHGLTHRGNTLVDLRRSHTNFYAGVTYFLSPFFQSRGVVRGLGRDLFLPILPSVPVVGRQMLLTMMGLKRSYWGGRIELPMD